MLEKIHEFTGDDVLPLPPVSAKQHEQEVLTSDSFLLRRKNPNIYTSSAGQASCSYFSSFAAETLEAHLQREN